MIPLLPSSRQDSILYIFSESHSAVGSLTLGNKAHDASVIFETMYVVDSVGNENGREKARATVQLFIFRAP